MAPLTSIKADDNLTGDAALTGLIQRDKGP